LESAPTRYGLWKEQMRRIHFLYAHTMIRDGYECFMKIFVASGYYLSFFFKLESSKKTFFHPENIFICYRDMLAIFRWKVISYFVFSTATPTWTVQRTRYFVRYYNANTLFEYYTLAVLIYTHTIWVKWNRNFQIHSIEEDRNILGRVNRPLIHGNAILFEK